MAILVIPAHTIDSYGPYSDQGRGLLRGHQHSPRLLCLLRPLGRFLVAAKNSYLVPEPAIQ